MPSVRTVTRRELFAVGTGAFVLGSATARAQAGASVDVSGVQDFGDDIVPFTYGASDEALADLRGRLGQTRWPESETAAGWEQGSPLAKLQDLVAYWRTGYDWRRCEAELSRWAQYKTAIDGLGIHFIHVRSRHPDALPIVLTHG